MYIFGSGGHGRVVYDILRECQKVVDGFVETLPNEKSFLGVPVLAESELGKVNDLEIIVAVGANHLRRKIVDRIRQQSPLTKFISAIHPSAVLSKSAIVGDGSVVSAGAIIGPGVIIGSHTVINTGAQVDHDTKLGHYVTVAPGATLGGNVEVGEGTYIAISATVVHNVKIGAWSVLGAGALAVGDIPSEVMAYGLPCRVIRSRKMEDPYL